MLIKLHVTNCSSKPKCMPSKLFSKKKALNKGVEHTESEHFLSIASSSLQKQVGCVNHKVVTMVADKLERQ